MVIPSKREIYFLGGQSTHPEASSDSFFPRQRSVKKKKSHVTFLEGGRRNPKINGRTRPRRRCRGVFSSSILLLGWI